MTRLVFALFLIAVCAPVIGQVPHMHREGPIRRVLLCPSSSHDFWRGKRPSRDYDFVTTGATMASQAYQRQMESLVYRYPDDLNAQLLLALSLEAGFRFAEVCGPRSGNS